MTRHREDGLRLEVGELHVSLHTTDPEVEAQPATGYARFGAPGRWPTIKIPVDQDGNVLTPEEADAIDPDWRGPN